MKTVIAGALGECVHVAGVLKFLRLAEIAGWRTVYLGPAVQTEDFIEAIEREDAELVGISYRLTPENGERLLGEFAEMADELRSKGTRFVFGGTPPVVDRAQALGFFEACFDGTVSQDKILAHLRGIKNQAGEKSRPPQNTIDRINWKSPYPLLRHHYGQPDIAVTRVGIEEIANAGILDVISLGIDQDAQENFFHPDRQDIRRRGAGGVPVRAPEHYRILYKATRRGNFPLLRTYSGSDDFIRLAEMYVETIHQAWAAVPLFWFNRMDGRGPWDLTGSICQHQAVMAWYGTRNIPVEVNDPHHWGMRDAHDVVFVVAAYLSAYNARFCGVKDYIAQLMFNSPPGISDAMDLAKMLAVREMIKPLAGIKFRIWTQTRTGLLSYPVDKDQARAHLASSVYLQMAMRPDILHVVSYTEAHHAARAADVIESCKIAQRVVENALGAPDMTEDKRVQERKNELVEEAGVTLEAIKALGAGKIRDPLVSPEVLTTAIKTGILDAPQLKNNLYARGEIHTSIDSRGACLAISSKNREPIMESERIRQLGEIIVEDGEIDLIAMDGIY